ncbi:hypothetical protein GQ53DRAFT_498148 [Thozetella sp. PMI_491]|nr:hypothetical protein GQ53DRAFT_498148 [Thozetella sp. PMI_491]
MRNADQVAPSGESDWAGEDDESVISFPSSISALSEELSKDISEEILEQPLNTALSIHTPTRRKAKSAAADRIKHQYRPDFYGHEASENFNTKDVSPSQKSPKMPRSSGQARMATVLRDRSPLVADKSPGTEGKNSLFLTFSIFSSF